MSIQMMVVFLGADWGSGKKEQWYTACPKKWWCGFKLTLPKV